MTAPIGLNPGDPSEARNSSTGPMTDLNPKVREALAVVKNLAAEFATARITRLGELHKELPVAEQALLATILDAERQRLAALTPEQRIEDAAQALRAYDGKDNPELVPWDDLAPEEEWAKEDYRRMIRLVAPLLRRDLEQKCEALEAQLAEADGRHLREVAELKQDVRDTERECQTAEAEVATLTGKLQEAERRIPHPGDGSCDRCGKVPSIVLPTSLCAECCDGVTRAEQAEAREAALVQAGKALYAAGRWETSALSGARQATLWENLRDALGLPVGWATANGVASATSTTETALRGWILELLDIPEIKNHPALKEKVARAKAALLGAPNGD